ncbi:hypothetical protein BD410DRAFT_842204 [Rickenella mellea]|uniref:Uncharacterized protein n=1 Tax=Rickenella mellea TaxID=50990 RepID=A0A4Y7PV55_9AGAM|nr:hypothetical protein BD410DRAFT_842204 [Rickenella mellea]
MKGNERSPLIKTDPTSPSTVPQRCTTRQSHRTKPTSRDSQIHNKNPFRLPSPEFEGQCSGSPNTSISMNRIVLSTDALAGILYHEREVAQQSEQLWWDEDERVADFTNIQGAISFTHLPSYTSFSLSTSALELSAPPATTPASPLSTTPNSHPASQGTHSTPSDILTQMLHDELGLTNALLFEAVINKLLSREMEDVIMMKRLSSSLGYSSALAFLPGFGGGKGVVVSEEDEEGVEDERTRDGGILPASLTRSNSKTRQQPSTMSTAKSA